MTLIWPDDRRPEYWQEIVFTTCEDSQIQIGVYYTGGQEFIEGDFEPERIQLVGDRIVNTRITWWQDWKSVATHLTKFIDQLLAESDSDKTEHKGKCIK